MHSRRRTYHLYGGTPPENPALNEETMQDMLSEIGFEADYGMRGRASVSKLHDIAAKYPGYTFKEITLQFPDFEIMFVNEGTGSSRYGTSRLPSLEWLRTFRELFGGNPYYGSSRDVDAAILAGNADLLKEFRTEWGLNRNNLTSYGGISYREVMYNSPYLNDELKKWGFSEQEIEAIDRYKRTMAATATEDTFYLDDITRYVKKVVVGGVTIPQYICDNLLANTRLKELDVDSLRLALKTSGLTDEDRVKRNSIIREIKQHLHDDFAQDWDEWPRQLLADAKLTGPERAVTVSRLRKGLVERALEILDNK